MLKDLCCQNRSHLSMLFFPSTTCTNSLYISYLITIVDILELSSFDKILLLPLIWTLAPANLTKYRKATQNNNNQLPLSPVFCFILDRKQATYKYWPKYLPPKVYWLQQNAFVLIMWLYRLVGVDCPITI